MEHLFSIGLFLVASLLLYLSLRLFRLKRQLSADQHKVVEMGKDFVANASHELRTPLTIVRGFAETLQDLEEMPREMLVDITEKIVRNCQRMDTLIKNLLTLAEMENLSETRFQECDLVALCDSCVQVIKAVYESADIRVYRNNLKNWEFGKEAPQNSRLERATIAYRQGASEGENFEGKPTLPKTDSSGCFGIDTGQEAPLIFGDPDLLELAILNLLDNACKYSDPPAKICIQMRTQGQHALLLIRDQGIGIPSEDLEHIFERFYRVDKARSRRLGGAGLGLCLVKTIIEKHKGTITVHSSPGQGTTFTLCLRLSV